MGFATALREAKEEFDAWDAAGKTVAFQAGSVVYTRRYKPRQLKCACGARAIRNGRCGPCRVSERAARKPPCTCGNPYFARGICSSCYYKEINKHRSKVIPKIKGRCKCGRYAIRRNGQCARCYRKIFDARRRGKKAILRMVLWTIKKLVRLPAQISLIRTNRIPAAHGTYSRYKNQKCRCEPCMVAQAAYWREYRKRRPGYRMVSDYVTPSKSRYVRKLPVMDLNHDSKIQNLVSCQLDEQGMKAPLDGFEPP